MCQLMHFMYIIINKCKVIWYWFTVIVSSSTAITMNLQAPPVVRGLPDCVNIGTHIVTRAIWSKW